MSNNSQYINSGDVDYKHSKLEKSHEVNVLTKKLEYEKDLKEKQCEHELALTDKNNSHELKIKNKDLGWLGICFGGRELVSLNISGLLIIVLIIGGVVLSCLVYDKEKQNFDNITKVWSVITPIITLSLGYLFGNKQGGKD